MLRISGRRKAAPAADTTPKGVPDPVLRAADRDLLAVVDSNLKIAARKAGAHLACRLGCTECCIGPFPINRLDAWRLQKGLRELEARAPDRAEAIRQRAAAAVRGFRADFPGDPATGRLSGDEADEDRFFEAQAAAPCPVLDTATGGCELYEHRPIFCRSYGPPVTVGGRAQPPCRLCFTTATPAQIEPCRVEPDPDRIEEIGRAHV